MDIGKKFFSVVDLHLVRLELGHIRILEGNLFQFFQLVGQEVQVALPGMVEFLEGSDLFLDSGIFFITGPVRIYALAEIGQCVHDPQMHVLGQ